MLILTYHSFYSAKYYHLDREFKLVTTCNSFMKLMLSLHLRSLARYRGRNCARYRAIFTYLGRHVAQGSQGKYYMCCCRRHYCGRYRVTFANVNDPLSKPGANVIKQYRGKLPW
jgi:hypothetical protein